MKKLFPLPRTTARSNATSWLGKLTISCLILTSALGQSTIKSDSNVNSGSATAPSPGELVPVQVRINSKLTTFDSATSQTGVVTERATITKITCDPVAEKQTIATRQGCVVRQPGDDNIWYELTVELRKIYRIQFTVERESSQPEQQLSRTDIRPTPNDTKTTARSDKMATRQMKTVEVCSYRAFLKPAPQIPTETKKQLNLQEATSLDVYDGRRDMFTLELAYAQLPLTSLELRTFRIFLAPKKETDAKKLERQTESGLVPTPKVVLFDLEVTMDQPCKPR